MALLEIENLGISFGGLRAVDGFHICVKRGQLYGLIGPNGAGKTTLFNLLTGVYTADTGTILLDGHELVGRGITEISRRGVSRTFQNIRLFGNMSVLDNVIAGLHGGISYGLIDGLLRLSKYRSAENEARKAAVGLLEFFSLADNAYDKADSLPYGSQRRLEIARAIAAKPKLLLLDEPAAGMNPNETQELMHTIRAVRERFDVTILLIEHDMRLVSEICERLTVLNFGTVLAEGETSAVLNDERVISAYLGG